MSYEEELKLRIMLLEMEVSSLRSVLSEFEGDKLEFLQMIKANTIQQLLDQIIRPRL